MDALSPQGTHHSSSDDSGTDASVEASAGPEDEMDGRPISLVLILLWFLLAGVMGVALWYTGWMAFMMLLIHANSSLVLVVATLVTGTVLLAALVPLSVTHLVLVCRRRRSRLRDRVAVLEWGIVFLLLCGVWFLLPALLGPE